MSWISAYPCLGPSARLIKISTDASPTRRRTSCPDPSSRLPMAFRLSSTSANISVNVIVRPVAANEGPRWERRGRAVDNGAMNGDGLGVTRRSLHAVAELVLAGPQYRATGRLRLRVVPGGFATAFPPDVRVQGASVEAGDTLSQISGQTARTLGARLGIAAGGPEGAYRDGCGVGVDEPLALRADHAAVVLDALALGHDALA